MKKIILVFLLAFFSACSNTVPQNLQIKYSWWEDFNDPNLNKLIDKIQKNNFDLKISKLNLQKLYLNLKDINLLFVPNLSLSTDYDINKQQFNINLNGNYEFDISGKNINKASAQKQNLIANEFEHIFLKNNLIILAAKNYFALISLKKQKDILILELKATKENLKLQEKIFKLGEISLAQLKSLQAQENYLKIRLLNNEQKFEETLNSLKNISADNKFEISSDFQFPNLNVSLDQIEQRSDIKAALFKLKEANFIEKTQSFLPNISIKAFLNQNLNFGAIANSFINILQGNERKIAKLNKKIEHLRYEKILKNALNELNLGIKEEKRTKKLQNLYLNNVKTQEKIYKITKNRYNLGIEGYLDLLNQEKILLDAKLEYENSNLQRINSILDLYKIFG